MLLLTDVANWHTGKSKANPKQLENIKNLIVNRVMFTNCGTLKCENASICEKAAKCEKTSTLNVKIDAICKFFTLNVKKLGSLNA